MRAFSYALSLPGNVTKMAVTPCTQSAIAENPMIRGMFYRIGVADGSLTLRV